MNKYLFLDFDGVITTEKSNWNLCPDKLELLGKIIEATDCKLVISSSWRRYTLEDTIDFLSNPERNRNLKQSIFPFCDRIVGVTDRMYSFVHGHRDKHFGVPRGVEIDHWVFINIDGGDRWKSGKNVGIDYNYVILDDDDSMLLEQMPYYIKTSWGDGLNEDDVKRAIEILNKGDKDYELERIK